MAKKYKKYGARVTVTLSAEHVILIQEKAKRERIPLGTIVDDYLTGKRDFLKDIKEYLPFYEVE